jgi:hypothetical protein
MEFFMTKTFFSHVLDDPLYIGNNEYITVVTTGKVNITDSTERDINKDAAAKAGLIRINTKTKQSTFIDLHSISEDGDRYRGAIVIDSYVYIMRTQKKHVDSVVRIAKVDLRDNTVEMIEEKAVSIHGTETPKTFCGHFNFGRPVSIGKKIVYPPLNSGVAIVFDTETNVFVAHDIPNDYASIWSTHIPESNEVVFFPYGNLTTNLLVLNLNTNQCSMKSAPNAGTFYSAFSHNSTAYGVPLLMEPTETMYFWMYKNGEVSSLEYKSSSTDAQSMTGFKYGTVDESVFYTHTCWENGQELVKFDLNAKAVEIVKTDLALGAKPVSVNGNVYLFPSIQNTAMLDAPSSVYKLVNGQVMKEFDLPSNNISYSPINNAVEDVVLVPYKFEYNAATGKLDAPISIVRLAEKSADLLTIELELE